jgi:hypothetical protein
MYCCAHPDRGERTTLLALPSYELQLRDAAGNILPVMASQKPHMRIKVELVSISTGASVLGVLYPRDGQLQDSGGACLALPELHAVLQEAGEYRMDVEVGRCSWTCPRLACF